MLVKMKQTGCIYLIIGVESGDQWVLDNVIMKQPLTLEPIGIALAPGDPLLINLVQNYMQALAATGALEALQAKWFNNAAWMAQMP